MAYNNIHLQAIDLFCGAGGLSCGLENAGIPISISVEYDSTAAQTYQYNHRTCTLLQKDIRKVTSEELLKKLGIKPGDLFLMAGCPPCQTFSSLQKDNVENDERNNLIFNYINLVRAIRPLFILLENVPGLKTGKGKNIFKSAQSQLSEEYAIISKVINCADYGIPQTRRRLLLLGIRKDAYNLLKNAYPEFNISLPGETHTNKPDKYPDLLPWNSCNQCFLGLPPIKAGCEDSTFFNHEANGLSDENIKRIQYIRKNGGSRTCLPPEMQLKCHSDKTVGYTGVYGIIDPNKPAPTMTGGCITYSKGRFGHPTQDRAISIREAARIQTFPDTYRFFGNRNQKALQVGNAVPPEIAEICGRHIINIFNLLQHIPSEN